MDYTEVKISITPFSQQDADIITALLAEIGFDSFAESENELNAYIPTQNFDRQKLEHTLNTTAFSSTLSYNLSAIEDQNWNTKWEQNFSPIAIDCLCYVRAPFHESKKHEFKVEIVIEPKMAFGTGHHETTWLMLKQLFSINLSNKNVLDMGCGTGILAIGAEKLGAKSITAIDNDTWAYQNTKENVKANACSRVITTLGDATLLGAETFDIILANINLNILLADMKQYVKCLANNGILIMSGILQQDLKTLEAEVLNQGLLITNKSFKNDWAAVIAIKANKP